MRMHHAYVVTADLAPLSPAVGTACRPAPAAAAGPMIANLKHREAPLLLPVTAADGRRLGNLPIAFDYADLAGGLDHVLVTLPEGTARKSVTSTAERPAGTAHLLQAVLLPSSGEQVRFTVQAVGAHGHLSNVLAGTFVAP